MKTKVEINGFEVCIEDVEGKIEVKIEKDDEVVEELILDPADYNGGSDEDDAELKAFGDEGDESEEGEVEDDGDAESEDIPEEEEEMMGENVKSFGEMFPVEEAKEEEGEKSISG